MATSWQRARIPAWPPPWFGELVPSFTHFRIFLNNSLIPLKLSLEISSLYVYPV